jgi:hypothetical protein
MTLTIDSLGTAATDSPDLTMHLPICASCEKFILRTATGSTSPRIPSTYSTATTSASPSPLMGSRLMPPHSSRPRPLLDSLHTLGTTNFRKIS